MKNVLVTGAAGGMGKSAVMLLREKGYSVFALDRKPMDNPPEGVVTLTADVTDGESIKNAFTEIKKYTDELCGILHFAGIYMLDSLVEMSADAFEKIFKVNLTGVFLVNKTFLPLLVSGSRILITTSELAPLDPLPFTGIYAVTKSALDKYAFSLRMELQLKNIHISVLRAGAVETGMLGVSTDALECFRQKTKLYPCNSERFRQIVNKVEARCVPPQKIAEKTARILQKRKPKFAYSINRNPLLLILEVLPHSLKFFIINQILKNKGE